MSVFVRTPAEFGAIASTLRTARPRMVDPLFPLSSAEMWDYEVFKDVGKKQTKEEYRLSLIKPFVFRLYLANMMSHCYTYWKEDEKEFVIPLPELPEDKTLDLPVLLSELKSVRYNILTNGGNTFLGVKDAEKLDGVISNVQSELIRAAYR